MEKFRQNGFRKGKGIPSTNVKHRLNESSNLPASDMQI